MELELRGTDTKVQTPERELHGTARQQTEKLNFRLLENGTCQDGSKWVRKDGSKEKNGKARMVQNGSASKCAG